MSVTLLWSTLHHEIFYIEDVFQAGYSFLSVIDHLEYHPTLMNTTEHTHHSKCDIFHIPDR